MRESYNDKKRTSDTDKGGLNMKDHDYVLIYPLLS